MIANLSYLHARRLVPDLIVDALHHGLDLLLRAALIELGHPVLDHGLDDGRPKHWAHQLPAQQLHDLRRTGARRKALASGVHIDLATRRLHVGKGLVESLLQLLLRRLHQRGVKAAARLEKLGLQGTSLLRQLLELIDRFLRTSTREAFGEERVGDPADGALTLTLLGLSAEALEHIPLQPDDRQHGLLSNRGSLLHGLAPQLHQLQRILEAEHACGAERCVLSEGKARHTLGALHGLRFLRPQFGHRGETAHEHGGLAVSCLSELVLRALQTELQEIVAKNILRRREHVLDFWNIFHAIQHLHVL
mmetsp:Transcript_90748/g.194639  ORF Transcript_90748/g.194639 Transcript_90748/m.194639 type:complete len:306 (+) Transcript_90748:194-1111(+)